MVLNQYQFNDTGPVEEAVDLPVEEAVDCHAEEAVDLHVEEASFKPPKVVKSSAVSQGKLHFWFILPRFAILLFDYVIKTFVH